MFGNELVICGPFQAACVTNDEGHTAVWPYTHTTCNHLIVSTQATWSDDTWLLRSIRCGTHGQKLGQLHTWRAPLTATHEALRYSKQLRRAVIQ
jgi:hypothetical protein